MSVNTNNFLVGDGVDLYATRNFGFSLPAEVGMNKDSLSYIDSIVINAINDKIMPGCQVTASRYGKIFYNRAFGFHTYDSLQPVSDTDLYDMEAYALAKLCLIENINYFCFKYVSDRANENATEDWKKNVSDGGEAFAILLNSLNG